MHFISERLVADSLVFYILWVSGISEVTKKTLWQYRKL